MGRKENEKNHQVDLINVIVDVLAYWRSIFCVLIISFFLCTIASYVRNGVAVDEQEIKSNIEIDNKSWEEKRQLYREQLTTIQATNVETAYMYDQRYNITKKYQDENTMLQADPLKVVVGDIVFVINADNIEKSYNIQEIYDSLANSIEIRDMISKAGYSTNADNLVKTVHKEEKLSGTNVLHLNICYLNLEGCKKISEFVIEYMMQSRPEISEIYGKYEVTLISQAYTEVADTDLMKRQNDIQAEIYDLLIKEEELIKDFSEEQNQYFLSLKNENLQEVSIGETGADTVKNNKQNVKLNKREIATGTILITIVYCCILCLKSILSNELRYEDSIEELYEITQLGEIRINRKKKNFLSGIDEVILKWRNCGMYKLSEAEAIELTCINIKAKLYDCGIKKVIFVTNNMPIASQMVCEKMKDFFEKNSMQVDIISNILCDGSSMKALENAKGVVLVETVKCTKYKEIEQEIRMLNRQNIPIVGTVVISN